MKVKIVYERGEVGEREKGEGKKKGDRERDLVNNYFLYLLQHILMWFYKFNFLTYCNWSVGAYFSSENHFRDFWVKA